MKRQHMVTVELEVLYSIVGSSSWTVADIPLELARHILKWKLDGIVITESKKTRTKRAVYRLSERMIKQLQANDILQDPAVITEMAMGNISYAELQRRTGYTFYVLKKRLEDISDENKGKTT